MLLIAAASEVVNGIENLWKRGKSTGQHDYPNFGQYMPMNYFKAFVAAAAYCWADQKCWYIDKKGQAASVGLVQKCMMIHLFGFELSMATAVGTQRSGKFKMGARQEIRSL
jgi:hypothetical protein